MADYNIKVERGARGATVHVSFMTSRSFSFDAQDYKKVKDILEEVFRRLPEALSSAESLEVHKGSDAPQSTLEQGQETINKDTSK